MKKWGLFAIGLGISAAACLWIARNTDLSEAVRAVRSLDAGPLAVMVTAYVLGFLPRTYRTVLMCGDRLACRPSVAAEAVVLGYASNNVLPLRLGEVVRTVFFSARGGIPLSTSLALVAAERFLDACFLALVLCAALLGFAVAPEPMPRAYEILVLPASLLFLGALTVAIACIAFHERLAKVAFRLSPGRLKPLLQRTLDATTFLRDPGRLLRVALLSAAVWLCEGGLFVATAWSLGIDRPLRAGYLALAVVNLGVLIPSSPGYVGVFHAAAVFALVPLGVSKADALAFALVTHALPYLLVTSTGLLIFLRHHALLLSLRKRPAP